MQQRIIDTQAYLESKKQASVNAPNFFILGAAKSGTTSLYHYVKQHPEIFMSDMKEPSFFCETFQKVNTPASYFELFANAEEEKVIGEASHVYLTDPKSPKLLKHFFPNAKFLVSLRNPAERAFSLYSDMRNQGWESINSFDQALAEEARRQESEHFKWTNPQYLHNFLYFNSGLYGKQLQRYFSVFDKSQFLVIKFDDLIDNYDHTLRSIFQFLEIDDSSLPEHKVYNKTYHIRSVSLQRILNWALPDSLFKQGVMKHTYGAKPTLDKKLKVQLMERYKEDQALLFSLCGVRLT